MMANRRLAPAGGESAPRVGRRRSTAGSTLVESLSVTPLLLALIWLAWNLCWALFAKSSLQNAVDLGARAAVTGYLQYSQPNLMTTVAAVAEHAAPQFLTPHLACTTLGIQFYDQLGNAVSAPVSEGVVTVSVTSYPYTLIAPILAISKSADPSLPVGSIGPGISVTASRVSQPLDPLTNVTVGTWPSGCS